MRECKKEEAAPVLDDDALNDLLARRYIQSDDFCLYFALDVTGRLNEISCFSINFIGNSISIHRFLE